MVEEEPPTRTDFRIIVQNLPIEITGEDLKNMMRRTGKVTYANAHNDRSNQGIVEFAYKRDLEQALDKYNGYELHGRRLKVFKDPVRSLRSRSRSPLRPFMRGKQLHFSLVLLHTGTKVFFCLKIKGVSSHLSLCMIDFFE